MPKLKAATNLSMLPQAEMQGGEMFGEKHSKTNLLRQVPLFANLGKKHLNNIAQMAEEVDAKEGDTLVVQGDTGWEFLLIVEGHAMVVRDGRIINYLGPGDFFGEIALLDGRKRIASVIAETSMRLLAVHRQHFDRLIEESPSLHREIHLALCRYTRESKPIERFRVKNEPVVEIPWGNGHGIRNVLCERPGLRR